MKKYSSSLLSVIVILLVITVPYTLISLNSKPNQKNRTDNREEVEDPTAMVPWFLVIPDTNAFEMSNSLLGDLCMVIENENVEGSSGYFKNGRNVIGIDSGVVLSTGSLIDIPGINNASEKGSVISGVGDPDLSTLAEGKISDASVLEFDIYPTTEVLRIRYAFASEGYCESIDDKTVDAFGIFVSGPGMLGPFTNNAVNIATVPGGAAPVNIKNINWLVNDRFYRSNVGPSGQGPDQGCTVAELNAPGIDMLQLDGITTVLEATVNVIPCLPYHIKIAIGDANPRKSDSAVFLETNSLNNGKGGGLKLKEVGYTPPPADFFNPMTPLEEGVEGCNDAFIVFEKTEFAIMEDYNLQLVVDTPSKATEGLDFVIENPFLHLPPGVASGSFEITILEDTLIEGVENLTLSLVTDCPCPPPSYELFINDHEELIVRDKEFNICGEEDDFMLSVDDPISGTPPFYFEWSNGFIGQNIIIPSTTPKDYKVTVTESCGNTAVAEVEIIKRPKYLTSIEASICQGDYYLINGIKIYSSGVYTNNLTSVYGCDSVERVDLMVRNRSFFDTTLHSCINDCAYLNGEEFCTPGSYRQELTGANSFGCDSIINFTYEWIIPNAIILDPDTLDCRTTQVQLSNFDIAFKGDIFFSWTGPDNFKSTEEKPWVSAPGEYFLEVTFEYDGISCTSAPASTTVIQDIALPEILIESPIYLPCNQNFITLTPYIDTTFEGTVEYLWTGPNGFFSTDQNPNINSAGKYQLKYTNPNNYCNDSLEFEVFDAEFEIDVDAENLNLGCDPDFVIARYDNTIDDAKISWIDVNGNVLSQEDSVVIHDSGQYILSVSIGEECTETDTFYVEANNQEPSIQIDAEILTCENNSTSISVESDKEINNYAWTGPNGFSSTESNPTVNISGTYTLLATDIYGCQVEVTKEVEEDIALPEIETEEVIHLTCVILEGSISLDFAEEVSSIEWTTDNGMIVSGQQSNQLIVGSIGDYIATVISAKNGCSNTFNYTISEFINGPEAKFTYDYVGILVNFNSTASLGTPTEYLWDFGDGQTSQEENPTYTYNMPGVYNVCLTITNECGNSTICEDVTLKEGATLDHQTNSNDALCNKQCDGSVSFELNDNQELYTIDIEGPNGFTSDKFELDMLCAGKYYYTLTNDVNESVTDSFEIMEPEPLIFELALITYISCNGLTDGAIDLTISGGTGDYTIIWDNGLEGKLIEDLPAGKYEATVTDENNCELVRSFDLTEPDAIVDNDVVIVDQTPTSLGSIDLTISGGVPEYTFLWSNGETTEDIADLEADTYNLVVTDETGCTQEFEYIVDFKSNINETEFVQSLKIYPNPATNNLYFDILFKNTLKGDIVVIDKLGREMYLESFETNAIKKSLDLQNYSSGVYFVYIQTEEITVVRKIVILNR